MPAMSPISYTGSFIVAVIAGSLFVHAGRRGDGAGHHPPFLHPPARGPAAGHLRPRHRASSRSSASSSAACRRRCRRRRWSGITPLGFMFYPTYRLAVVGIVAVALLALYHRALPHPARHDRARRHRGFGDGRFARHQRLPRVHDGVRHRRDGGGLRRHRQRAGGVARRPTWARRSWCRPSSWS